VLRLDELGDGAVPGGGGAVDGHAGLPQPGEDGGRRRDGTEEVDGDVGRVASDGADGGFEHPHGIKVEGVHHGKREGLPEKGEGYA